jgi:3-phenylpropionate/cinnamic acid dioxygenase small subunit
VSESDVQALAARVERLEAERAIVETMYAYGRALDYGERDTFLNCFTSDAHYLVDMRLGGPAILEFRGQDELAGYYDWHTHAPDAWHKHVTTNPSVTVTGATATAVSYFLRVDADAATALPSVVSSSGRYVDELARGDDGTWRIRSRHCQVENL